VRILCVDFGSTFTKAVVVDAESGELVAAASHPTTIGTDLMEALDAIRASVGQVEEVRACSSAGGGLRIAVVGNEELVTSEAGRRVAMSSGGLVVHVASGEVHVNGLLTARPDLVLLVGGTDGGNTKVLRTNAKLLAQARLALPVVGAGNVDLREELGVLFAEAEMAYVPADNVLPEIGVVKPESARAAIRDVFVRHVIGGKELSRRAEFARIVRGATPDLVLRGVEVLAAAGAGDVAVVDVGGATTDVHSVLGVDPEAAELSREVVATLPVSRTVEGDLGLRWNAAGIVAAGQREGLLGEGLEAAVERRVNDPAFVAATAEDLAIDELLARTAITVALRRHAGRAQVVTTPAGRVVERTGKDLRALALLVGSGGLLRHGGRDLAERVLAGALVDQTGGGWLVPENPRLALDQHYILAATGLLADDHPEAARALVTRHLL
jgi:uncharacterized protein (TIGR01319 family)